MDYSLSQQQKDKIQKRADELYKKINSKNPYEKAACYYIACKEIYDAVLPDVAKTFGINDASLRKAVRRVLSAEHLPDIKRGPKIKYKIQNPNIENLVEKAIDFNDVKKTTLTTDLKCLVNSLGFNDKITQTAYTLFSELEFDGNAVRYMAGCVYLSCMLNHINTTEREIAGKFNMTTSRISYYIKNISKQLKSKKVC